MNEEAEKQLKWLLRSSSSIRNRGLTILAYICTPNKGVLIENVAHKHRSIYFDTDTNSIEIRTYPRGYTSNLEASADGLVHHLELFPYLGEQDAFMCGWKLKPSVVCDMMKNKTLSAHERLKLQIAIDTIEEISKCPPTNHTYCSMDDRSAAKRKVYDDLLLRMQQRH